MADDVTILDSDDVEFIIGTDEIAGNRHIEYVKLMDGTDASSAVIPGSASFGLKVEVTKSDTALSTNEYAIKRTNIAQTSVNLAFGFTSSMVEIKAHADNTADVAISWLGSTVSVPAANTAGFDLLEAGDSRFLPRWATTSVSVITASGTATVWVRAWR